MKDISDGLDDLRAAVRQSLADLCAPAPDWVPARQIDGETVCDVVIVGGGMCGLVAWHALTTGGMRNIRILDRADPGREGPWITYARMETLRSPKQLVGPAFGNPFLTFRAYHRARFGAEHWETLDKIPRPMWMEYLAWYRDAVGVPVENGIGLRLVEPEGDLLRLHLDGAPSVLARKLVLATGRDGTGVPNIPGFVSDVPRDRWSHSSAAIDFAALKDRRVAVIGVGASAIDNAAEALEAGAAEVRHIIRRPEMPTVNKMMGIGNFGFTAGYSDLSDEWRWRFMQYSFRTQTPPPHGSTMRVSRHANAYFHFGKAVRNVVEQGDGVRIDIADGTSLETDFVILGTGFVTEPAARTELGDAAGAIRLWRDAYAPPPGEENADLGRFPYLAEDFTFQAKDGADAAWLSNVYCFNYGASASMGKVSGDIPGISDGAAWLARAMASRLYAEDVGLHWQGMQDYAKPELNGEEWRVDPWPEAPAAARRSA